MQLSKAVAYPLIVRLAFIILIYMLSYSYVLGEAQSQYTKFLVEVVLNAQKESDIYEALQTADNLYLSHSFFESGPLQPAYYENAYEIIDGKQYINITNLTEVKSIFNSSEMTLNLEIPAKFFKPQLMKGTNVFICENTGVTPLEKGAYLNYNVTTTQVRNYKQLSGFTELIAFNDYGSIHQETLANIGNPQKNIIRLRTFYQFDKADDLTTLLIGDTNTNSGNAVGSALFAGLKYSTDFSLNPNLIVYPLAGFRGTSALPSNIEIFADTLKVYEGKLRPGEYHISDIPAVTGKGNLEAVVTDITGNVEKINIPYYTSPKLLKEGVNSFSVDAGKRREKFGIKSNQYSNLLGNFYYRQGINNNLTLGSYLQGFKKLKGIGGELVYNLMGFGLINTSLGISEGGNGNKGYQTSIGYEYQAINYSGGVRLTNYKKKFSDIASYPVIYPEGPLIQTYLGYGSANIGSFNLNYTKLKRKYQDNFSFLALNYSKNIASKIYFTCNAGKSYGTQKFSTLLVGIRVQLGDDKFLSISREKTQPNYTNAIEYTKNMNQYLDNNYRIKLLKSSKLQYDMEYSHQFSKIKIKANKNNLSNQEFGQINLRGGVVYDGNLHLSTEVHNSFTIAKVSDNEGVTVAVNNNEVGSTDQNGSLVLTNLIPYTKNEVLINEHDIPLHASITDSKLALAPERNKAYLLNFRAQSHYVVRLKIIDSLTKTPVNPGSVIVLDNNASEFIVGYNGEVFLTLNQKPESIKGKVCTGNECCYIDNPYLNIADKITDLETVECKYLSS